MSLRTKKINRKTYYYIDLSYRILSKQKTYSKYVGTKKPTKNEINKIEEELKSDIISKKFGKVYSNKFISKDGIIKTLLFREAFNKKFSSLSDRKKRTYETNSMIIFTLTTLTTENVDVNLDDVVNAFQKNKELNTQEQISKNMLNAVDSIKKKRKLDKNYILELHKQIMSKFDEKKPGQIRRKQVYLHKQDTKNPLGIEIGYRPPQHEKINKLLDAFVGWHNSTKINPIEKAALAHYKLYNIHPFLDGNKRICRLILNKTLLDEKFPLLNISEKKEFYFQSLISSVEKKQPEKLVEFTLKEFLRQTRQFLKQDT